MIKINLQKPVLALSYMLILLTIPFFSCTGPDGPVGPAGVDGIDGVDGVDGADGNANVEVFLYPNATWNNSKMELTNSAITETVLQEYLILGYVNVGNLWVSTDGVVEHLNITYYLKGINLLNMHRILAYNNDGTPALTQPPVNMAKIIIIQPTNVTLIRNGRIEVDPREAALQQLEDAGVDINDYEQVAAYYNIQE